MRSLRPRRFRTQLTFLRRTVLVWFLFYILGFTAYFAFKYQQRFYINFEFWKFRWIVSLNCFRFFFAFRWLRVAHFYRFRLVVILFFYYAFFLHLLMVLHFRALVIYDFFHDLFGVCLMQLKGKSCKV